MFITVTLAALNGSYGDKGETIIINTAHIITVIPAKSDDPDTLFVAKIKMNHLSHVEELYVKGPCEDIGEKLGVSAK